MKIAAVMLSRECPREIDSRPTTRHENTVVTPIAVAAGFLFVGAHTNTLTLDGFGNLWIGDDPSDGTVNFTGRLWRVPAALLQTL